ncbi:MAG: sulfotransferase domain-containing protein, partial [Anaerolineales bacterium]|nr:sulfotransferase domain-containing protein [Anaerolineales bacterium]
RSIFTETFIRDIAQRWVDDLSEIDAEARRLYGRQYHSLRYEDLLETPFAEMTKLWKFLGVKKISRSLEKKVQAEMSSNPDEEWQAKRNEDIASFLPKGQAGNWQRLFTVRDKSIFKEVAGETLVEWGYERDLDW